MKIGTNEVLVLLLVGFLCGLTVMLFFRLAVALLRYLHAKTAEMKRTDRPVPGPAEQAGREPPAPLSEQLKKRRATKGLSQEALAAELGVSRQAVSKWENGDSEPSTANLLALAALYGISVDELLRGK